MSKKEKLLQKIRNNPKQVSFADLDKILTWYGFTRTQPRSGSSHYGYMLSGHTPITVPFKRPHVKEKYVRDVLALLDEIDVERESE